jgi:branched-chain amino acid transport system substrate-binding protein
MPSGLYLSEVLMSAPNLNGSNLTSAIAIFLRVGEGSFELGFPVELRILDRGVQIWHSQKCPRLPPAPELLLRYQAWKAAYDELGKMRAIEPVAGQVISGSSLDACQVATWELQKYLVGWFENDRFVELRHQILARPEVNRLDAMPVIFDFSTGNERCDACLRRLPWHLWDLFDTHLRRAEGVLHANYGRPFGALNHPVKILAIFGSSEGGLLIEEDRQLIESLQDRGALVECVQEPSRERLHELLTQRSWDILFFAGHSSSDVGMRGGSLQISDRHSVALASLRNDLRRAVEQGLKLAIFNSCDGLGIADGIADLLRDMLVPVPTLIVMREPVPDLVARRFLRFFLQEFAAGRSLSLAVREARDRLDYLQSDDVCPCPAAPWLPIILQNPGQVDLVWPAATKRREPLKVRRPRTGWIAACVAIGLAGVGVWWGLPKNLSFNSSPVASPPVAVVQSAVQSNFSDGDTVLLSSIGTPDANVLKNAAVELFKKGNYTLAAKDFERAFTLFKDPETLIYLNNARIGDRDAYEIAVVVPSGKNAGNAVEMLRGYAQVQDEINQGGGINGKPLKLQVVNDNDNPNDGQQIANRLAGESSVLAVTGHWTSDVSMAAVPVYKDRRLVFMTPMSQTTKLTGFSNYVLRTNVTTREASEALVKQMLGAWQKKKVAIFYVGDELYSKGVRDDFKAALGPQGEVVAELNFLDGSFDAAKSVEEAIAKGAEVMLLATTFNTYDVSIAVIEANYRSSQPMKMLGTLNLYQRETLANHSEAAKGMVIPVSWSVDSQEAEDFAKRADNLWGGTVNSPTANSYDALMALGEAIKRASRGNRQVTREAIKEELRAKDFQVRGAGGLVQFDEGGDRVAPVLLVEVQQRDKSLSGTGFDFVTIKTP